MATVRQGSKIFEPEIERASDPWLVDYDEIKSSYILAMQSAGIEQSVIDDIVSTVEDFAINNLGDD